AEHLPQLEPPDPEPALKDEPTETVDDATESGAYTLVLPSDDLEPPGKVAPREAYKTIQTEIPAVDIKKIKTSPETNVLPGAAGSKSDMQAPTTHIKHGRNTSPVDGSPTAENEIENGASYDEDRTRVMDSSELPGSETLIIEATGDNRATEAIRDVPPSTREVKRGSPRDVETAPFGKDIPLPAGFQPDDYQTGIIHKSADRAVAVEAKPGEARKPVEPTYPVAPPAHAKPESKPVAKIITIAVVLAILATAGYVAWSYVGGRAPAPPAPEVAQPTAPPVTAPQPPAPPAAPSTPVPPEGMVFVAGGNYVIGRDDGDKLEGPMHSVQLTPFFIDKTEVTNEAYKAFIDATGRTAPATWKGSAYPEGRASWPVTDVSWEDAAAYAAWAGKRLPTEEEWEAAARGTEGRVYPWGNDWRTGVANIQTAGITDVGKFQAGASPSGALDMVGNVWEWTATEFEVYPGNNAAPPANLEPGKTYRVIRGGAYDGSKLHAASYRGYLISDQPYPKVGFRCAKNAAGGR
ncbi:MAG TPA: SUMF1/EgtB/PvdO family nonheme iron enzyme, partial [Blastocatellia bacterium]|nr:SUMF1/EgtB/PvdO family nonheme iron enzyme [Blastocatellia bacterium]